MGRTTKYKSVDGIINDFRLIHKDKYEYSLVDTFILSKKIKIICPNCGVFEQIANDHLRGHGCNRCSGNVVTKEMFIENVRKIYGDVFDYSKVNYVNAFTEVEIVCKVQGHGSFFIIPNRLLRVRRNGNVNIGCKKCVSLHKALSIQEILRGFNEVHGDLYDYSLVEHFCDISHNVKIICKKPGHGVFEQSVKYHLAGGGCPKCALSISKGERYIIKWLTQNGIYFELHKTFSDFKSPKNKPLSFDFYIPKKNILIEFDGNQHYDFKEFCSLSRQDPLSESSKIDFQYRQSLDIIKTQYSIDNHMTLIRFREDELKNLEQYLELLK